jgi:hypothetical protein
MGSLIVANHRGKVFCVQPRAPAIDGLSPPPAEIITRDNQICILYSGDWIGGWGGAIIELMRKAGCSLEWQCYLSSYADCNMAKQRKPACSRCRFREECREVARRRSRRR